MGIPIIYSVAHTIDIIDYVTYNIYAHTHDNMTEEEGSGDAGSTFESVCHISMAIWYRHMGIAVMREKIM